jgi:GNAT superfamily N-acetyltransferase
MPFRRATVADLPAFMELHAAFYAEDGYPHDEVEHTEAARVLLETPTYGQVWLAEADGRVVAYFVLVFGYSLEFRGRDAFLDELFVAREWRGRGLGTEALDLAEQLCRAEGIKALHLEVEREKPRTVELYRRKGFEEHSRYLMTRLIG